MLEYGGSAGTTLRPGFYLENMKSSMKATSRNLSDTEYDAEDEMVFSPRPYPGSYNVPYSRHTNPPADVEIRRSGACEGNGVWARLDIKTGQKFGPFEGILRPTVPDTSCAWEIVDETGRVKGWVDSSDPSTGGWMKFVASTESEADQNVVATQIGDDVYYRAIRDIRQGEELLLFTKAGVYQEKDLESLKPRIKEVKSFSCEKCKECFKSKVALRRHETYVCNNEYAVFSPKYPPHPISERQENEKVAEMEERSPVQKKIKSEEYVSENEIRMPLPISSAEIKKPSKVFYCENCPLVFHDVNILSEHIRDQHQGARSFPCAECGKTFATSSGLKQHQHIHSSVKPFQCEVCLKAYTQFSNLCRHKRMHASCRQQITCSRCKQPFSTIHSLNKHKPFCAKSAAEMTIHGSPLTTKADFSPPKPGSSSDSPVPKYEPTPYINSTLPLPCLPPLYVNTNPMMPTAIPPMNPLIAALMMNRIGSQQYDIMQRHRQLLQKMPTGVQSGNTMNRDSSSGDENPEASTSWLKTERVRSQDSVGESNDYASSSDTSSGNKTPPDTSCRQSCSPAFDLASYPIIRKVLNGEKLPQNDLTTNSIIAETDSPLDLTCTQKKVTNYITKKTHVFNTQVPSPQAVRTESPYDFKKNHPSPPFSSPYSSNSGEFHNSFAYSHAIQQMTMLVAGNKHECYPQSSSLDPASVCNDRTNQNISLCYFRAGHDKYVCRYCAKIFPRSVNLSWHLFTHTGESHFTCDKEARDVSIQLNQNIDNSYHHHAFTCGICERKFSQPSKLTHHLQRHDIHLKLQHQLSPVSFSKKSELFDTDESASEETGLQTPQEQRVYDNISPASEPNSPQNELISGNEEKKEHKKAIVSPAFKPDHPQALTPNNSVPMLQRMRNSLKRKSPTSFPSPAHLVLPKKRRFEEEML